MDFRVSKVMGRFGVCVKLVCFKTKGFCEFMHISRVSSIDRS